MESESWSWSRGVGVYFLIHDGVEAGVYFFIFDGVVAGVYLVIFGEVEVGAGVYNFQRPGAGVCFILD